MKKIYLICILICVTKTQAQDKIKISLGNKDNFIETYKQDKMQEFYNKLKSNLDRNESEKINYVLDKAYRIGPSALKILKDGVATSLKWIELNENHQKTFEKEICRFKVMDKETFKFHGYVDQFALEIVLYFNGFSDGTFTLELKKYNGYDSIVTITELEHLKGFQKLLDGKSAENEIDDIFKN